MRKLFKIYCWIKPGNVAIILVMNGLLKNNLIKEGFIKLSEKIFGLYTGINYFKVIKRNKLRSILNGRLNRNIFIGVITTNRIENKVNHTLFPMSLFCLIIGHY